MQNIRSFISSTYNKFFKNKNSNTNTVNNSIENIDSNQETPITPPNNDKIIEIEKLSKEIDILRNNYKEKKENVDISNFQELLNKINDNSEYIPSKYNLEKLQSWFEDLKANPPESQKDFFFHLRVILGDLKQTLETFKPYGLDTLGDLELYSTNDHPEPRHTTLIEKAKKESEGYANLIMELEGHKGSCFIVGEDDENLYLMTNKHVLFDDKKNALVKVKNIDFTENSGIYLKEDFQCESYTSNSMDLGLIKLSKEYLRNIQSIHITPFSPNLIDNKKLIIAIGNSRNYGTSLSFGEVLNNHNDNNSTGHNVKARILTYGGNSGGPIYSFNIIENNENFKTSEFYVVGILGSGNYPKQYPINGNQKIDGVRYDRGEKMKKIEEKILKKVTKEKREGWEAYKEKHKDIAYGGFALEYNIEDFFGEDSLIGFREHRNDTDGNFISSDTIIKEIEIMKKEHSELSNLNLTILPKEKVEDLGLDEMSKSNQMK